MFTPMYLLCVVGYICSLSAAFVFNGGIGLVLNAMPRFEQDFEIGSFSELSKFPLNVLPVGIPLVPVHKGSTLESVLFIWLISISVVIGFGLIQWAIGFLWPFGIVAFRRRKYPPVQRYHDLYKLQSADPENVPLLLEAAARELRAHKVQEEIVSAGKPLADRPPPADTGIGSFLTSITTNSKEEQNNAKDLKLKSSMAKSKNNTGIGDDTAEYPRRRLRGPCISFRVVTRGDHPTFVSETCAKNIDVLESYTIYPGIISLPNGVDIEWIFEVVTEKPLNLSDSLDAYKESVWEIIVPSDYTTENGTFAKARNLEFANRPGVSCVSAEDFVVHLDEETRLQSSSVEGILDFIMTSPEKIGQGMVVFGHDKVDNLITTMTDSFRALDDYCAFRVWHTIGIPLRGMKGSFFVLKQRLECEISFDVGPNCSMLEDAAFALKAASKGKRFGYIRGVMLEQSPLTLGDFFKQRRRWIRGLWQVCMESSIPVQFRILLILSSISWIFAPFGFLSFLALILIFGVPVTVVSVVLRAVISGTAFWGAFWGACINFSPTMSGWSLYILRVLLCLLMTPFLSLMECVAVFFAIAVPVKKFEVVKKRLSPSVQSFCSDGVSRR